MAKKQSAPTQDSPNPWRIDGARLRESRDAKQWRQMDVAYPAGVTLSMLSKLENNVGANPTLETCGNLADVLEVSLDWLCGKSSRRTRAG